MKRSIISLLIALISISAIGQSLNDLSFGTDNTMEVLTWNMELFPSNPETSASYISQIINALDADVMALQEIKDLTLFSQMINGLEGYAVSYGTSGGDWRLAYVYRSDVVQVNSIYEIYTSSEYSNPFPRRPLVMDFNCNGENYIIINNHFKAMGDGILDLGNIYDEETRRYIAINLIKEYIDTNFPTKKVFVVGDMNDEVTDAAPNNVFQNIIDDSENYLFADYVIASGNSSSWSYPSWPSHIDHIIITNELFDNYNATSTVVQTIKIDSYLPGGLTEYYDNVTDHRPVAMKFSTNVSNLVNLFSKNFEDQSLTSGSWTAFSVTGAQVWNVPADLNGHNNSYYGYMNGYSSGAQENEDWFISPAFNPNGYDNLTLSFWNTSSYTGPQLKAYYSYNYTDNPTTATWTEITGVSWHSGVPAWEWTYAGEVDLSALSGSSANIAFKYTSTNAEAAAWKIDDILLSGQIKSFEIAASAIPTNGGTVSGNGTYEFGEVAELIATPSSGYNFVNWTENGIAVSTNPTYSFEVTQSRTLAANFELESFTISASANPANAGTITGAGTYNQGETVTLTATANTGFSFTNWTENETVVSTSSTYSFSATSDRTLVANFSEIPTFIISASVNPESSGVITGDGFYYQGETVTLTATANTGFSFIRWTENEAEVSTNSTYSFIATSNRTLVANFTEVPTFTISASVNPENSGVITGAGIYNQDETVTLTVTANTGFNFISWTENETVVSTSSTYSFSATSNRTLVANFAEVPTFTISASVNPENSGIITGAGIYNQDETVTLTVTSNTGFSFISWTENETLVSTNSTYTFAATSNRILVANFEPILYSVTVSVSPANSGSATGTGTYYYGDDAELNATANDSWEFQKWVINESEVFENPTNIEVIENITATAIFTEIQVTYYNLTIEIVGSGTTRPDEGTYSYPEGTVVNLTATPNEGWEFEKWIIETNEITEGNTPVTINDNVTATAIFTVVSSTNALTNSNIYIYPNPTSSFISIENVKSSFVASIYNIWGQLILQNTSNNKIFDVSNLPAGVYLLKIDGFNETACRKFVKK